MSELHLELYVTGQSARSLAAIGNLERICRERLRGGYQLTIIDVLEQPDVAEAVNIVATPTLIRRRPTPVRRLVGDLSPTDVVLRALGIDDELVATPDGGLSP